MSSRSRISKRQDDDRAGAAAAKSSGLRLSSRLGVWTTALACLGALLLPVAVAAAGFAVEGMDRSRLLAPAGAHITPYSNTGYRLEVIGDEVRVEVDASPLISNSRFQPLKPEARSKDRDREPQKGPASERQVGSQGADAISRLARGVTAGADTQYEATSRILGWVARHIEYNLDRQQPQDSESVLKRRSGYCTGVARLTVSMLESVGIESREVAGYVVGGGGGGAQGYHRWIETFLPDRGWVFSDPLSTHHYVPATYIRLGSEMVVPEQGLEGLLLERRDEVDTVDVFPLAAPGVTARRNSERQLAATLSVRLEDQSHGIAVLTGKASRMTHALVDGGTTFVGLDPGNYELRLLLPGRGVLERQVDLPGLIRKTLSLPVLGRDAPSRGRESKR